MNFSFLLKILILIIVVILIFTFLFRIFGKKELQLISPNGKEIWRAGSTYQIKWRAKNIAKIDIVLVNEEEPKKAKIIAKDVPAKNQKYDWQIFVWEETGQNYKISIYESPWREGNKIDYSDSYFIILGPKFASCDQISIEKGWIYIPSDYPNLKKVFITSQGYSGNLGGLEGADDICKKEAEKRNLEGEWKAFLGDEYTTAKERLNLEGIFISTESEGALPQDVVSAYFWKSFDQYLKEISKKDKKLSDRLNSAFNTLEKYFNDFTNKWNTQQERKNCYPLLGKNFEEFFKKLTQPILLEEGKAVFNEFLSGFRKEIWLGRIDKETKKTCISIFPPQKELSQNFSYTSTCQNWTTSEYKTKPPTEGEEEPPHCYTPEGIKIYPVGIAGFSLNISKDKEKETVDFSSGRYCNSFLRLLCIQQ